MLKGLIDFVRLHRSLFFNEQVYVAKYILPREKGLGGLWTKCPKLHFCIRHSGNRDVQRAVLGMPIEELLAGGDPSKRFHPSKPTVLLVTHQATRTGAPKVVLEILKHFARTHNTVFVSLFGGDLRGEFMAAADHCICDLGVHRLQERLQAQLRQICKWATPEFAIVNSIGAARTLPVIAGFGIPTVTLIHEIADLEPLDHFREVALSSKAIVFPAEFVKQRALERCPEIDPAITHVIPQGILRHESPHGAAEQATVQQIFRPADAASGTVVVYGGGTVDWRKGTDLFVQCAELTARNNRDVRLRFVWSGSGFSEQAAGFPAYLRYQMNLGRQVLKDGFVLTGDITDLDTAYSSTDIFFLSSRFDPLPLVAQLAMAKGIPVVCFDDSGGIPEYLEKDPDAAFGIVPYLDLVAAAKKIVELAGDADLRRRTGEACRRIALQFFDEDAYFQAIERLGASVVNRTGKSPIG